jgi:hypothetical protein
MVADPAAPEYPVTDASPATPRAYPSTSLRWAVGSLVAVLALSVVVILRLHNRIDAYEAGYAAATQRVSATVVSSQNFSRRIDLVTVEWWDGEPHRHTFEVGDADNFPVGSVIAVRLSDTAPDEVYAESSNVYGPADWRVGIGFLIAGMILATLAFLARGAWLWRAARGPARRYRAHLLYSYGKFDWIGVPWLSIEDNDQTWYQCVMWEPWVATLHEQAVIEGRRTGNGPFVIDVPGYGRLWPVGRARRREPRLQNLVRRHPNRYRLSRVGTAMLLGALLVSYGTAVFGWLTAAALFGYTWLLTVFCAGATALPVPFLRARTYPRIPGLQSFTPTDNPAPLPKPYPHRPRRRRS